MDAVKPYVDEWLLEFIKIHVFTKKEYYENIDGGLS